MKALPFVGTRIRMLSMHDDPAPIPVGELGTVRDVSRHGSGLDGWLQIEVEWDCGRTLMLVSPPDAFELIGPGE